MRLPGADYVYVADCAGFPYGTKDAGYLDERLPPLLSALAGRYAPDLVVIACNTASTLALPAVRAALSVPVVGTVPAIKPAAALSRSRAIGLLGTPATVKRAYTDALIAEFAADCRILRFGSAALVELAEAKLLGGTVPPDSVRKAIAPLLSVPGGGEMDTVVLACTHFPLLRAELAKAAPRPLSWIDSGAAIARRVTDLLGKPSLCGGESKRLAVVTGGGPPDARYRACFAAQGFARLDLFDTGTAEAAATTIA